MASTPPPASAFALSAHTPPSAAAPLSAPPPPAPPFASELDTTMEDAEEEEEDASAAASAVDDEFAFNAPTFYDLKHPERERQYVNNADGYFYTPPAPATPQRPTNAANPFTPQQPTPFTPQHHQQQHCTPQAVPPQTPQRHFTPQPPTPHTPFTPHAPPREPPTHAEDADAEMAADGDHAMDADADGDDRMSDGGRSDDTLVLEALATGPVSAPPRSAPTHATHSQPPPPAPRSHNAHGHGHSHSHSSMSSSLLQPTKSFLMRMQAEQAERERGTEDHHGGHASKLTHPRSPQLRTTQKAMQRQHSEPKLSSTSRELQKIQEEKMRLQVEAQKVRHYHERVRAQRVPANVHQRSTKQLTIPQSPYLEVGHRTRRALNHSMNSSEEGDADAALREEPHPYIPPEQFLSRDYEFPVTHAAPRSHNGNGPHGVTVPQPPQLHTSERAARRNVFPNEESPERPRVDYSKMKVNGVTRPLSPQFETDRRAAQAAAYRKPIEVVDKDEEELKRKFHARPVPRTVLEAPQRASPQKAAKSSLTKPVSPKLATSSRARFNASNSMEEEHNEKKALSSSNGPRRTGPVIPETPPLRSLQRHQMYQENLRRRQEAEEEEMRRQREFKAQPLRVTATPPKFEGSKRPLTEVQPFALRGDYLHERAQERLERKKREEEEKLRAAAKFRAMPMPDLAASEEEAGAIAARAPARSLTKPSSPRFATDRRAAERAAFEAAERERRARDEEEKRRADEEKRRREEEEIKRLRREQLTFHARPAPVSKGFEVKPSARTLTEPESPMLQTKVRGGSATTAA